MQMKRQLYANGGIMDVTPREKFGLGSKLKKFVRKIIPNEVADIATKAAPFVAPFNPALAGVMGGLGSFDQTGSISGALKSGALNYGGGQLARYAGGAGFQGNPFGTGGAFTQGGFQGGFSSPFGTQTGIGKMLNKPIEGVGVDSGRGGTSASALSRSTANVPGAEAINITPTNLNDYVGTAADIIPTNLNDYASITKDTILQNNPGVFDSITNSIKNFDYKGLGDKTLELGKKFGKAAFTNPDGSIDKAAVMGAIAFAGSYAEALALADDAGVELTEEQYDEATKADKQEEYAGYLTNFFGGKKDGGRIGFEGGANELIMEKLKEDIMPDTSTEDMIMIMTEAGPKMIKRSDYEAMSGMFRDTTTGFGANINRIEEANGGRIGFEGGANKYITKKQRTPGPMTGLRGLLSGLDSTIDESDQKIIVIMTEDGPQTVTESEFNKQMGIDNGTGPIIIDMQDFLKDKNIFKDMKKDGGRIGRKFGSPEEGEKSGVMEMLAVDVDAGGDDEEDMLMAYTPGFSSQEKSYLFRRMGASGGAERSYTMPQLYRILKNPADYPEDAAVLKEIAVMGLGKKDGGRIGFKKGANRVSELLILRDELVGKGEDVSDIEAEIFQLTGKTFKSVGGISEIPTGEPRLNAGGVAERDYRQTGGFVPVGIKERADDVPAMLSKNEFVMTADAVRGIGNGSVEEGSRKLYNTMKQAEKVGKA